MGSYNYTISIGHLGEQLTLNQWVLGSSPRWCTKKIPRKKLQGIFYCCFPGHCGTKRLKNIRLVAIKREIPQYLSYTMPANGRY